MNTYKSGCENRTRVSASTRLKDNHYPNPDTLLERIDVAG